MAGNGFDAGCSSEASGFSATFETNDHDDVKSEHDQQASNKKSPMLEFVKLSNDDSICGSSKVELDFFHHDKVAERVRNKEGIAENTEEEEEGEEKASPEVTKSFSCSFCKREFSSSQALGGHQNAHKQERAIAKRRQEIDAGAFGYPYFPSLYGSSYNRALGVRMESMIHKPSSYNLWNPLRYAHAPPGWSRLNSSTMEGLQQRGGGVGILGGATSSILKVHDENLHVVPHFGGSSSSSSSSANVAPSSSSGINRAEEPSTSSILDLSLKL